MDWKDLLEDLKYEDAEETVRLIEISEHFLSSEFGHSNSKAKEIIYNFLKSFSQKYDEDFIHHEMPYRFAATAHYIIFLKGEPDKLGNWLLETGHINANREADEYFRNNFYS